MVDGDLHLSRKTAFQVAKFLLEHVFCTEGAPEVILSDQGKEFLNAVVDEICRMDGTFEGDREFYRNILPALASANE